MALVALNWSLANDSAASTSGAASGNPASPSPTFAPAPIRPTRLLASGLPLSSVYDAMPVAEVTWTVSPACTPLMLMPSGSAALMNRASRICASLRSQTKPLPKPCGCSPTSTAALPGEARRAIKFPGRIRLGRPVTAEASTQYSPPGSLPVRRMRSCISRRFD